MPSERLWNPPRALRSSTGERSPLSHGVKMTSPAPAGIAGRGRGERGVARRLAVAVEPVGRRDDLVAQPLQARAAGLVVVRDEVAVRASGRGRVAIWRKMSVFLNGTAQLIHDDVLIARCVS